MNRELATRILKSILPDPKMVDPELLYVECEHCGRPVLWEKGRTTAILRRAGIDPDMLDNGCLIMSQGCSACMPGELFFETRVVRLSKSAYLAPSIYTGEGGTA